VSLRLLRPRLTIRSRIALAVLAASTVILALMSGAVYISFGRSLRNSLDQDVENRASSYASVVNISNGSASLRLAEDPQRERAQGEALVRLFDKSGRLINDGSPATGTSDGEASIVHESSVSAVEVMSTLSYADGERFRVVASPISASNGVVAVLVTGLETSTVDNPLAILGVILLLATPTTSLALAFVSFVVVRRGLRPIVTITESARRIAAGNLDERIPNVEAHDEIGEMTATFNEMIERLGETVERERRFTADAAHELRTPLAAIETAVDVTLSGARSSDQYVKTLRTVRRQTERLDRLMRQLLLLSRADIATFQLGLELLDVGDLVETVSRAFGDDHPEATLTFRCDRLPLVCHGDKELLARAFSNVLENAVMHGSSTAKIMVNVGRQDHDARIVIADDGPGVSSELAHTVFHRFRRGEASRSAVGTGLGLAIVDSIMRVHHGAVRLLPAARGAAFEFRLPLAKGV
jgi:two-component system, OmpR family, sensor kinase